LIRLSVFLPWTSRSSSAMAALLSPKSLDFPSVCSQVLEGVDKLLNPGSPKHGTISRREYQYMFQDIYSLCNARDDRPGSNPEPHFVRLYHEIKQHLETHTVGLREEMEGCQGDIIKAYNERFVAYEYGSECTDSAFRYLNGLITKKSPANNFGQGGACGGSHLRPARHGLSSSMGYQTPAMLPIHALALKCWRDNVYELMRERIIREVLKEIEADRRSESCNLNNVQSTVYTIVKMCEHEADDRKLKCYTEAFETPFLRDTANYYERQCAAYLSENDCASYMILAGAHLDEEAHRGTKVLHETTRAKSEAVCQQKLVFEHREMMYAECRDFLQREQILDLQRMYRLLRRVDNGIDPMLTTLEEFVQFESIKKIRALDSTPMNYVECVIQMHRKFTELVETAFDGDAKFTTSLDKAIRGVINTKGSALPASTPELLAKFVDGFLRKSSKAGTEAEVEDKLVQAIFVFQYIDDKDLFQKIYSKMLAKRLIHGNSQSEESEGSMISKLKQRCGYEYTSKLQRMFTDMSLSAGLNSKFNQTEVGGAIEFGLKVLVLQSGAWPIGSSTSSFAVPQQLQHCVSMFERFYENQHSGRKLNWLHHLASADLKAHLGKRNFEFGVTAYQMAIMLLYNDADTFTVAQIREHTSLSEKELQRTLRSLIACHLFKCAPGSGQPAGALDRSSSAPEVGAAEGPAAPGVQRISSATSGLSSTRGEKSAHKPFEDECAITFNASYSNKKKKVKLSSAIQRDTPQESKQLRESVNEDRRFFLQAVTVRIMKMRRRLAHNLVVKEVIDQSAARFKPAISQIKRCIEELIDKQYLEREQGDKHMLLYVA